MPKKTAKPSIRHLRPTDLRAAARLAVEATHGVTTMAEGVHQAVWSSMAVPGGKAPGQTRGLTGFVYRAVHGVTTLVGQALEASFTKLEPVLENLVDAPPETPQREAVLAALNGVLGDRLARQNNPLATPMTLRLNGVALDWQSPIAPGTTLQSKVLLVIHGLCMNDLQWRSPGQHEGDAPFDQGEYLANKLGYTPIYLRYNTGLHTSENGALLSAQMELLARHWPVGVTELRVLAHSMGGLITRSALRHAELNHLQWPQRLKAIVFLGTPHHGSPLERAGNWVDVVLGTTPFSRPFAKLGQMRSAGITDLRYGLLLPGDWEGRDRFRRQPDQREHVPLPQGIACFTVAATTAKQRSPLAERILGDGLVPLDSALGQHADAARCLNFAKARQHISYNTHHMQLMSSPAVAAQVLAWLSAAH
jgi:pimeloyl-ACP methyl ester carboxylesterase